MMVPPGDKSIKKPEFPSLCSDIITERVSTETSTAATPSNSSPSPNTGVIILETICPVDEFS